jgi:DTW domain-containing protein YfiP
MQAPAKRPQCAACLRAVSSCICGWVQSVPNVVELLILQHPLEVLNAKGTARLLHLSLPNSTLVVGEAWDAATLDQLLLGKNNLLLYPDHGADASLGLPAPPPCAPASLRQPDQLRLVVLDGTWRKSRKMLYLNPALQRLPRLPLRDTPPSHYAIRKAHAPDQLSTLEASCYALMQLEPEGERFGALIEAMDGFVGQQLRYINQAPPR